MMRENVKKLIALFGLALAFVPAYQAQTGKIDNIAEQAASVTEFEVNGLKVLVKRRNSAPTVAVGLFVRGGAQNADAKTAGLENLMLQTAIESGKKYPRQTLRRELARTASVIGATASYDMSAVSLVATHQNFDTAWNMFADVMLNPTFAPEDLEREKQQIITGLRSEEDNPDDALQNLQNRIVYAGHPYSNDPTGTIANVESFKPADLAAYHKKIMETSRLLLVIVGDIDANDLKPRIAATFGNLPRGSYKGQPLPPLDFSKGTLDISSRGIPTNYIQGAFSAPTLGSSDYYAMRVATTILQDMVFQEVRVKRNLSYAPSASMNNLSSNTGSIYVSAVDANQSVNVMLSQIKTLQTDLVDEDQISGSAGQFLTNYYLSQETNAAQAGELARYEILGGGWRNSFEFINRIREVKPADVRAVANKYIRNLRFVVIGNPSSVNKAVFIPAE
jgi:predicted Zn-dependent peptidase